MALGDTSTQGGDIINAAGPGAINITAAKGVFVAVDDFGTITDPIGVNLGSMDFAIGAFDAFVDGNPGVVTNMGPDTLAIIDGLRVALAATHPAAAKNLLSITPSTLRNPFAERGSDLEEKGLKEAGTIDVGLFGDFELYGVDGTGLDLPWYAKEEFFDWSEEDWDSYYDRLKRQYEKEGRAPDEFESIREIIQHWRGMLVFDRGDEPDTYANLRYVGDTWAEGGLGIDDNWSYLAGNMR